MSKFTQFWKSDISKANDEPEPGKIYALTGAPGDRSIYNGNSWAESEVKEDKKKPEGKPKKKSAEDDEDSEKSEKNPVVNGKQTTDEMERYARQHGSYRSDDPRFGDVYEE